MVSAILAGLLIVAYGMWAASTSFVLEYDDGISSLILIMLSALITGWGMKIAFDPNFDKRTRQAWLFLSLGLIANSIAEGLWFYYYTFLHIDPFPSPADVFYLAFYPLTLIGVLLFPFAPFKKHDRIIMYLDLVIIVGASCMVFWYFLIYPLEYVAGEWLEYTLALAYPAGDLLIFAGLMALIQRDFEKVARTTLLFLALGMVFTAFADILFAYFEITGLEYSMVLLNLMWMASLLAELIAAAWQLSSVTTNVPDLSAYYQRPKMVMRVVLPYLAAAVGPLLLVVVIHTSVGTEQRLQGLLYGTFGLIVLVLLRQYAMMLENIHLAREMEQLAIIDQLTQIYNRHFFNQTFAREVKRAERYDKALSVLLIDVDNFKMFNDTLGHLQGDEVLKKIAGLLKAELRASDSIARFGGDEFVIVLPETNLNAAASVIERISSNVRTQVFQGLPLGVSIGVGTYSQGITPEKMLENADQDLYRFKAARKHSTTATTEPATSPL